MQVSAGLQVTGSSQNRIVNSKSWQFSVGSHPTLFLNHWKDSCWLQSEGSYSCPSQSPAAKLTLGTALTRKWPGLRAVGGPLLPMHLWAPAKPSKSPVVLHSKAGPHMGLTKPGKSPGTHWKAAGPLTGQSKTQQKPQGTVERRWALCGNNKSHR